MNQTVGIIGLGNAGSSLEPYAYINYVLDRIADADTLEKLETLLPWNVPMERFEKTVKVFDGVNRRI